LVQKLDCSIANFQGIQGTGTSVPGRINRFYCPLKLPVFFSASLKTPALSIKLPFISTLPLPKLPTLPSARFKRISTILSDLPPICHSPIDTSQPRNLHSFLMPTKQHAHLRTTILTPCSRSTAHLRKARTLRCECRAAGRGLG
jgi:hypothetical protein